MTKEIEPGCLAVVIRSARPENLGKSVTVGKYIGEFPDIDHEDLWEVSKMMVTNRGKKYPYMAEENLLRIDNYQQTKTKEREAIVG